MSRVMLMILDGWGYSPDKKNNAIAAANTPHIDKLFAENPHNLLKTSGLDVGLPEGIMGNSEVGHMNIGAGRVVYQLNTMIDNYIKEGEFYENAALNNAIKHSKQNKSKLHLFALLSNGNVHSNLSHIYALLELCNRNNFSEVYLHAFMDGRDTLPHSGLEFIRDYLSKSEELGLGKVATISGRYYAMDRDNRWDRIEKAYNAIVDGIGEEYESPIEAIKKSYEAEITDEFILPKVIIENGSPIAKVEDGDSIIFANYRADRTRQLTRAFIMPDFDSITAKKFKDLYFVSMSEYESTFTDYLKVAFYTPELTDILGEVVSKNNIRQLRLAETEKYAHVTFFFNCGNEVAFQNEDRILIPSPRVASYDLKPEMSAFQVKDALVEKIREHKHELIIVNFANCDMVGHTGVFEAAVKAVETVDDCLGVIIPEAEAQAYDIIITADHGNAEKMMDEEGNIFTAHSTNKVPIIVKLHTNEKYSVKEGRLADLAPTILKLLQIKQPEAMTGVNLIER